jgi:bifunctional non-homologous end joining protein LigD
MVVSDMKKSLRTGKIFVDWSQNDDHKTTVCVYSLRAKERPTVSTPVKWEEVEECLKKEDPERLVFTSDDVLKRADKLGDLFEPVLKLKQKLPSVEVLAATSQAEASADKAASKVRRSSPVADAKTKTRMRKQAKRKVG